MRKYGILLFIATLFMLAACNPPVKGKNGVVYSSAISYNDYIVNRQTEVMKIVLKVSDEMKTDLNAADQTLNTVVTLIDKDITEIEGMPEWKGSASLRDNALNLFRFYKIAFGSYFRRIIAIQKDGEITPAEDTEQKQLVSKIDDSEGPLDAKFQKAQQDFSSQNGLQVQKNELQNKIDQMGK